MIKLTKGPRPQILVDHQKEWTDALQDLISKYGSYKTIPDKERDAIVSHYRHEGIKRALENDEGGHKCVYCESLLELSSYSNIEHFYPKSLYPSRTFCWENLFMACPHCNTSKDNFDTASEPFIHPVDEDPENYLTFDELRIVPSNNDRTSCDYKKAYNVIQSCNLKRRTLTKKYAAILENFYSYTDELEDSINKYNGLTQRAQKRKVAVKILESFNTLKSEACSDKEYAGYMRYLLRKFDVIREATNILNLYRNDLVPNTGFEWGFRY